VLKQGSVKAIRQTVSPPNSDSPVPNILAVHPRDSVPRAWTSGSAQHRPLRKQKWARRANFQTTLAHSRQKEAGRRQAGRQCCPSVPHGHTIARNRKEKTAPSARPRHRKKAMMAPAVSASAGCTFLKEGGRDYFRMMHEDLAASPCWPEVSPYARKGPQPSSPQLQD
jgi:hypothetical protein